MDIYVSFAFSNSYFTKGERRNRNPEYRRLSDTNFLTMMDNIMVYKGGWGSEGDTMSDKKRESWFFVQAYWAAIGLCMI